MLRRPLIAMSIAYFLVLCSAYGTGGLWPVYVAQLGGGPAATGLLNAVSGPANTIAALFIGWVVGQTSRRKPLFFASCLLFALTWWLMSRAATWQALAALNFMAGLSFGMTTNLIVILTGLLAAETHRGRSFGLLTFVASAGLLFSGLTAGAIADRWGFPTLLMLDAGLCLAAMLPGVFFVEPPLRVWPPKSERTAGGGPSALGRGYILLWCAALFTYLASFASSFGRGMAMSELGFSATAVSMSTAIGGAIGLPAPLVIGWLSDRIGRKRWLLLCLSLGVAGLLTLATATTPGAFWVASALAAVMMTAMPLMQALATDMLPPASLGLGLSLLSTASSFALLASALGIGVAIQGVGARTSFLVAALLPIVAIGLLLPLREAALRRVVPIVGGATADQNSTL